MKWSRAVSSKQMKQPRVRSTKWIKPVRLLLICLVLLGAARPVQAQDPITLIIQQAVIKVIKAVDLQVQKLQTKTIWLQNAQKTLENTMSKFQLTGIQDWVQKQKDLYQHYFDELWQVKDVLAYYHQVREIARDEVTLVQVYKQGIQAARASGHLSPEELGYISQVYTGIVEESLKNLDQVTLVIQSFTTQMSDAARLKIIGAAARAIRQNLSDAKAFTTQHLQLSLARARDAADVQTIRSLYGLN